MAERQDASDGLIARNPTEERISELEDRATEPLKNEKQREQRVTKSRTESPRVWDSRKSVPYM